MRRPCWGRGNKTLDVQFLWLKRIHMLLKLDDNWHRICTWKMCKQLWTFRFVLYIPTSQPGPGTGWEKFDKLTSPIWTFYVTQSFLSCDPFGFWSLRYLRVQGSGLWDHACVKNLSRVGGEVCAKFGGDWSGGEKGT